jgi:hypothetical protein
MSTVITGAANINMFRLLTIKAGLALEVKTGMGHSRNLNVLAARQSLEAEGIKPKRTKQALLAQIEMLITKHHPAVNLPKNEEEGE